MLASRLFKKGAEVKKRPLWQFMDRMEERARQEYTKILTWSIDHPRKLVLPILFLFAAALGLLVSGAVGSEFMPQTDESGFRVSIQLPANASLDRTNGVARQIEDYLKTVPEVTYYTAMVGGKRQNEATVKVTLDDRRNRSRSIWDVTNEVRNSLQLMCGWYGAGPGRPGFRSRYIRRLWRRIRESPAGTPRQG